MKLTLFFLLFLTTLHLGLAQNENDFNKKYDSTFSIGNGKYIFYKKKKSALYDDKNEAFIIPFQKNYLHYYVSGDLLIQITDEGKTNVYDWENGFNKKSVKKKVEHSSFDEIAETHFQCETLPNKLLLINEYYNPMPYDMPLPNMYGEDSISKEGNFVYPSKLPIEYKSGVFDTKSKKWLIKPENKSILSINNHLFVYRVNDKTENGTDPWIEVFEIEKNELLHVKSIHGNANQSEYESILIKTLGIDSLSKVPNTSSYYYSFKGGKKGLLDYCLFEQDCSPNFNECMETIYDFILFHPSTKTIITLKENQGDFNFYSYNYPEEKYEKPTRFNKTLMITENRFEGLEEVYIDQESTREINGSIRFKFEYEHPFIVIQDVTPEYPFDMPFHDIFGSDSIDSTGSLVYPPPQPGLYASGVFNIEKNNWVIDPQYLTVVSLENKKFIASKYMLDSAGRILDRELIQKLYDGEGNVIINNSDFKRISNLKFIQTVFETDSISLSSFQYEPKELLNNNEEQNIEFFTLRKGGDMRVYEVSRSVLNMGTFEIRQIVDKRTSLQLVTPSLNRDGLNAGFEAVFAEDNDKFHTYFLNNLYPSDSLIKIQLYDTGGLLKLDFFHNEAFYNSELIQAIYKNTSKNENDSYGLLLLQNDTLKYSKISAKEYSKIQEELDAMISFKFTYSENEVLVQHEPIQLERSEFQGYFWDDIAIHKVLQYEMNNNVVWKKENGTWKRVGRNYAELEKTPYGYIGRTARLDESIDDYYSEFYNEKSYDSITKNLKHQLSTYQLLDKNMIPYTYNANSAFNMIDEHEFGYQLFYEPSKSILVSLSGKVLCEDHFDVYYKEAGFIYGENEEIYKTDDVWGDLIFDEEGNPVILQKAEKRRIEE